MEIVYISLDRSDAEFDDTFGTMPWWSLPKESKNHIKNKLTTACKVTGIPTVIVLQCATGHFVTDKAREHVEHWSAAAAAAPAKAHFAQQVVIKGWMEQTVPISLAEARLTGWSEFTGIQGIVMTVLRHPALFLGVVLAGRWAWSKIQEVSEQGEVEV